MTISQEWQVTRHQLIQNDAEGPDIALLSVEIGEYFRSNEIWSTRQVLLSIVHLASEAEVDELNSAIWLIEHNVLRFNVSVNDLLTVDVVERTQKLKHDLSSVLFIEFLFLARALLNEFAAGAEFHAEVDEALILVRLVVVNYVRVIHLLDGLHLLVDVVDLLLGQFSFIDGLYR